MNQKNVFPSNVKSDPHPQHGNEQPISSHDDRYSHEDHSSTTQASSRRSRLRICRPNRNVRLDESSSTSFAHGG